MAPEFKGPGNASRDEVKATIAFQVLRSGEATTVFNPKLEVTVTGPSTASLSGKFVFARGKVKTFEPSAGAFSAYQIDATLQKRDGQWLFVSATATAL